MVTPELSREETTNENATKNTKSAMPKIPETLSQTAERLLFTGVG